MGGNRCHLHAAKARCATPNVTSTNKGPSARKPRKEMSPRLAFLLHAIAFAVCLRGAFLLNRSWWSGHAWSRWLAVAWGVVLGVHLLYVGVIELLMLRGHDPT